MKAPSDKIKLVIADGSCIARAGIRAMLLQADDIEVVGEAQDGFEARELATELHPRILLFDMMLPGSTPFDLPAWIRGNCPETRTLALTAHERDDHLVSMMEAGAAGYLTKNLAANRLIDHVRGAAQGTYQFTQEQMARAARWKEEVGGKWKSLSERERDVLILLAQGEKTACIASQLSISDRTVECHVNKITEKLGVDSRNKAALWVVKHFPDEVSGAS